VSKQMGHSNTKMIIEHYYRFIPNLTRQDGSAFDKAAAQSGCRSIDARQKNGRSYGETQWGYGPDVP